MSASTDDASVSANTKVRMLIVLEEDAGQRLDNFLLRHLKGVPKSKIYKVIRKGEVRVNKGRVKPDYRVRANDSVRIPPIRTADRNEGAGSENYPKIEIIHETDGWCAVNKPAGLAVHGGSGIGLGLIERLRLQRPECKRLELVHRLDRGTSGVLLIAKKRAELVHLQSLFREKEQLDKRYIACVIGRWPGHTTELRCPLERSEERSDGRFVRVSKSGKSAHTRFGVLCASEQLSLIQASPVTGRTHQIRVHARYLGHPLAGDDKYGVDELNKDLLKMGLNRLALHAAQLTFTDSLQALYTITAPIPRELTRFFTKAGLFVTDLPTKLSESL